MIPITLISTIGLPTISHRRGLDKEEPYLGLRLVLDPAMVTSTMVESGFAQLQNDSVKAMAVSNSIRPAECLPAPTAAAPVAGAIPGIWDRSSFARLSTGFSSARRAIACATWQ